MRPTHARTSLIGPKSQSAVASLCHPSSNTRIPRPLLHLLDLPLVAARRNVPTAAAAAHHLHVVAAHRAELAGLDRLLELPQRLVEEVVLHHPEHPVVGFGGVDHPLRVGEVVAHRLLQVDVPAVAEELDHAVDVQRDRQERLDRVDFESARCELGGRRERAGVGPVGLALRAPFFARIDERDDLDVGVVDVGAHVQVVDAPEPDERGAYRAVVGSEAHSARVSCWSSMVLPAGSANQICTVPSPCTPRVYSMPACFELGDGAVEVNDCDAVVMTGRVDAGARRRCTDQMQLLVAHHVPVTGHAGDIRPGLIAEAEHVTVEADHLGKWCAVAVHRHVMKTRHLHAEPLGSNLRQVSFKTWQDWQ